jgi:hypothetical protein
MDFPNGARAVSKKETHLRTNPFWITRRSDQMYSQAGFGTHISEQLCRRAILTDD